MAVKTWRNDDITISVDYDTCKGHGECAASCPGEVYDIVDAKAVAARLDQCIQCCTCVAVCPEQSITHSACG